MREICDARCGSRFREKLHRAQNKYTKEKRSHVVTPIPVIVGKVSKPESRTNFCRGGEGGGPFMAGVFKTLPYEVFFSYQRNHNLRI